MVFKVIVTMLNTEDKEMQSKVYSNTTYLFVILILVGLVVFSAIRSTDHNDNNTQTATTDDYSTYSELYKGEEVERWDPNSSVYSNYKYGFVWVLPNDVDWHYVTGTSQHTIFKVVDAETQTTVYANINTFDGVDLREVDFWDAFDIIEDARQGAINTMRLNGGDHISNFSFEKCTFCNRHAAREYFENTIDDARYDEPVTTSAISYHFYHYNFSFTITVKCYKELYELLGNDGMMQFFKGFNLIPILEQTIDNTDNTNKDNSFEKTSVV